MNADTRFIYGMMMKYLITLLIVWLHLPLSGQANDSLRRSEIEMCMKPIYSAREFQRIADLLKMTAYELCDYPVIFPIRKPQHISSGFEMRYHPIYRVWKFHTGIDISGSKGTPVYATGNGIVVRKGYCSGYGNFIEIQHAGGFRSFYAHLSKAMVNIGDSVGIARQIAYVGSTGIATGSHLHYEIRKSKRYLNPTGWCYLLFEMKIRRQNSKVINETSYIYGNSTDYELHREKFTSQGRDKICCKAAFLPVCATARLSIIGMVAVWFGSRCAALWRDVPVIYRDGVARAKATCKNRFGVCGNQQAGGSENRCYQPQSGRFGAGEM